MNGWFSYLCRRGCETLVLIGLIGWLSAGCGVVGPPIPPEDVGVAPTIEKQKKRDALEAKQRDAEAAVAAEAAQTQADPATQGQDENLPPLRPVGTR
jgi:hypothetical protein